MRGDQNVSMDHQDWTPIILRKKTTPTDLRSKAMVSAAQRSGVQVNTLDKDKTREQRDRFRKLDHLDADDAPKLTQTSCLSKPMQEKMKQARIAKNYTQQTLAQAIHEKPQTIQDLETGKIIQNPAILQKVNRALGISLRLGA